MSTNREQPTIAAHAAMQEAYSFFNERLWGGDLPDVLITLNRKEVRVLGYFSAERFGRVSKDGKPVHELAMNPMHFARRSAEEVLSTLVHEMAHVWQEMKGTAPRRGYHDREWGAEMERVGLMPSNTSAPGGKKTGQQMSHYIIPAGAFACACDQLLRNGWQLHYYDRAIEAFGIATPRKKAAPVNKTNRLRYCCPTCDAKVWGKPGLRVACVECDEEMGAGA